ncbi:hypothetical protein [Streptomyces sp. NPDC051364]|uniref:hypothetical protein n=1 Tax=Streptomyces sp. NPDC051364 TaxID=3155799 RepID=UPI00342AC42E
MHKLFSTRRIVLAGASLALVGGGIALPATAVAASAAIPQQALTLAPSDSADGIGTGGDSNAENTTVAGTATGATANSVAIGCTGACEKIPTGNATGGNASADAINTGDATSVGGEGASTGGTLNKVNKQVIKNQFKANLTAKLGN